MLVVLAVESQVVPAVLERSAAKADPVIFPDTAKVTANANASLVIFFIWCPPIS
jgi:hypothetical protein